jgi:hypothetical protein
LVATKADFFSQLFWQNYFINHNIDHSTHVTKDEEQKSFEFW